MSKAGSFADEAEALGWDVTRTLEDDGARIVRCTRGRERYNMSWTTNERGAVVFDGGWHWVDDQAEPWANVAGALRKMAEPEAYVGTVFAGSEDEVGQRVQLPFNPFFDSDTAIIDHVRGKTLVWVNSISGAEETGDVPAHSDNTRIRTVTRRVLDFASPEGFRSVYIDAIVRVK